jgi:hypothetical protein
MAKAIAALEFLELLLASGAALVQLEARFCGDCQEAEPRVGLRKLVRLAPFLTAWQ